MDRNRKLESVWVRMGITQATVRACEQMAVSAVEEKSAEYWRRCRDYLASTEHLPYLSATHKQRNWISNIQADLRKEGLI